MVNQNADLNAQSTGYPSGTPLHGASSSGHLGVVEYLVNNRAEINVKDNSFDFTPLHIASQNGHLNVVQYLVNQRADINSKAGRKIFLCLILLLFIMLLQVVILMLLNT